MVWKYGNPVQIEFGVDSFNRLSELIGNRRYALVTYGESFFDELASRLKETAGAAVLIVNDVAPNPDYRLLAEQTGRFAKLERQPDVIVALGGGSVIDSAKVFAAAGGDFGKIRTFLESQQGADLLSATPIIAVPTTAGTGSEVTCWGTVWDEARGKKYSLARPNLYPTHAVVDPRLMLGKPQLLTISTGLDALSHALESLWNVNNNPVSANHAVSAARNILDVLPKLVKDLGNIELRSRMAMAALFAGLAFSNTKTAIAHSLSYPITLRHGVQHGIACSFSLPMVLRSVQGVGGICEDSLKQIFGADLMRGADELEDFLGRLGISSNPAAYKIDHREWRLLIEDSLQGERGRNFLGSGEQLIEASQMLRLPTTRTA
ncbi:MULTISPECIES: iron-containing alcohol dehydrogenase PsrA [Bradyrhizobium]|uniref:Phosphonate metabolism-associated iron-containing alcohol dehydrogenase n=2 Tax=Bradyrhizobium TaxID=374 RepID=A0ABY0PV26_9BRAD|nr:MULTISPECIES: iron-containing alcohol dehydrogenase PsrA [Bradyrhizobium]SDI98703.1 phosphonate metabolism-associated iron-containing alcohol dehydrogenase [Bradyrhizobium ottawaense]SED03356.1 phosphonate metabolism-associated iron-containing alcohol dehydrogenase [Bradyrhizobium lablabi]SHL10185.1 phosphonate metabolism-associated iron-containing alcohol dehydrogenase [Bradyrhizobium lablabi]